ncbi:MAG: GNAT family N-acetyltransferase [Candidatus Pelethousia sp.]|nr:GNAT family N-acetyltransferase [Candidatus Pelethousia sp.]
MDFIHESARIFALNDDGNLVAEITFPPLGSGTVDINHTFVDPSLRGSGIAGMLMLTALGDIRAKGFKVVASCPYAAKWLQGHPEHVDLLAKKSPF